MWQTSALRQEKHSLFLDRQMLWVPHQFILRISSTPNKVSCYLREKALKLLLTCVDVFADVKIFLLPAVRKCDYEDTNGASSHCSIVRTPHTLKHQLLPRLVLINGSSPWGWLCKNNSQYNSTADSRTQISNFWSSDFPQSFAVLRVNNYRFVTDTEVC